TSNRLDLARLRRLEEELAERDETIGKQQSRLHQNALELRRRQDRIEELETAERVPAPELGRSVDIRDRLDLVRRLEAAEARCLRLEAERDRARTELRDGQLGLAAAALREAELLRELEELSGLLADTPDEADRVSFDGATFLYVGGRPSQVEQLRDLVQKRDGLLLTHDGGVENSSGLLPGLVARADAVFFPVDCVSHGAVLIAKRHCRELETPLIPLRHASVTCFVKAAIAHRKAVKVSTG
ncbi:DUF2325 domain-containing protein, partial [bacterium]